MVLGGSVDLTSGEEGDRRILGTDQARFSPGSATAAVRAGANATDGRMVYEASGVSRLDMINIRSRSGILGANVRQKGLARGQELDEVNIVWQELFKRDQHEWFLPCQSEQGFLVHDVTKGRALCSPMQCRYLDRRISSAKKIACDCHLVRSI